MSGISHTRRQNVLRGSRSGGPEVEAGGRSLSVEAIAGPINVVVLFVIVLSVIPVALAGRLTRETGVMRRAVRPAAPSG